MKAIILAAGYATRLFPLTENFPKPLIPINGKPMINYIVDKIKEINIEDIFVITNDKYFSHFQERKNSTPEFRNIEIINDQTYSNDDRLGALGDTQFVIDQKNINDGVFVICGDNIFDFSLKPSYELFQKTGKVTIAGFDVQDIEIAKKFGIFSINKQQQVTDFLEKPQNPPSTLASTGIYFYPQNALETLKNYIQNGNNGDTPGSFLARLINQDTVYAQIHTEQRYDVGSFENLAAAKKDYGEHNVDIDQLKKGIL